MIIFNNNIIILMHEETIILSIPYALFSQVCNWYGFEASIVSNGDDNN